MNLNGLNTEIGANSNRNSISGARRSLRPADNDESDLRVMMPALGYADTSNTPFSKIK